MKRLKLLHGLTGLLALALLLIVTTPLLDNIALLPLAVPDGSTILAVLLAAAVANLCLGSYITDLGKGRCGMQLAASTLIILSAIVAGGQLFYTRLVMVGLTLEQLAQSMLLVGSVLHFVLNFNLRSPVSHGHDRQAKQAQETKQAQANQEKGTVKWFNVTKGFGFITREQGDDIFVHYRAIQGEGRRILLEGQQVRFLVTRKDKGLQAEEVVVTE